MTVRVLGLVGGNEPLASPNAAARVVGSVLRHYRKQAGLRLTDVAGRVPGVGSAPTLSRYERAVTKLNADVVVALCRFYNVTDAVMLRDMETMVGRSHEKEWWSSYRDVVGDVLARLFAHESLAKTIHTYQEIHVPGMLQTAAYARAVMSGLHRKRLDDKAQRAVEDKVARRLQVRMQRQHLLDQASAPEYCALIAESVLGKPYGGPAVMREQLRHLYNLAENKAKVHIRILPGTAVQHASAMHPSMTLFKPAEGQVSPLIYLEDTNRGGDYIVDPDDVDEYKASLEELWELAGTKREALGLLQTYIDMLADGDTE